MRWRMLIAACGRRGVNPVPRADTGAGHRSRDKEIDVWLKSGSIVAICNCTGRKDATRYGQDAQAWQGREVVRANQQQSKERLKWQ